jgi:hypothetical protein
MATECSKNTNRAAENINDDDNIALTPCGMCHGRHPPSSVMHGMGTKEWGVG